MSKTSARTLWGVIVLILLLPAPGAAQGVPGGGGSSGGRIDGRYKFIPLPYVNYNRSIEFSVGALPMVMFNPVATDTISPSSIGGLLGFYSTNKTWFVMGFTRLYLAEDKWRITAAGGTGSINFQFYLDDPIDAWLPYNTQAEFVTVGVQRRVVGDFFLGVNYVHSNFLNTLDMSSDTSSTTLDGIGLNAALDSRSNVYYPRNGFVTNVSYTAYPEAFGNEEPSNTISIDYNHYWPARAEQDVIAVRGYAGLGIGDLTFNQQYVVGQNDIRGYTQGEYRGNYLVAAQGEYRFNRWGRWGLVGFFGLATVFDGINEGDNGKILPGIGTGIRFTAFPENHMNIGMDIAVGNGDWGLYFRASEAF